LKYSLQGKARKISFGTYPTISLEEARKKPQEAKEVIAKGITTPERRKDARKRLLRFRMR